MKFSEFGLHENLLQGIASAGYEECTPVQEQMLKEALSGSDMYVQSQTGTGKTASYLITILQELLENNQVERKQVLILLPTRELAVQVEEEAVKLSSKTPYKAFSFYGGVGYEKQIKVLKNGVNFIIGTPGRIIDLHESSHLDLSKISFLVIDEADRMFDMGFYGDLRKLLKFLPSAENRQTLLFSATLNSYVKNLAWEYTRDAKEITIEAENITVSQIAQSLLHVSSDDKVKLLTGILTSENPSSVLVFCNTKKMCEVISKRLSLNGFKSEFIIGDLPQKKRLEVLNQFKDGSLSVLVATDVAARGIDVHELEMVINYDLPNEAENYVHRIGRTARAGKSGKAYTFCSEQDVYSLPAIERYIEMQIPSTVVDSSLLG
ncbi:MAG: DEAD/DEAH box helicase, partial [Treponema sp.]|nr:DEAD/DEAH box helicase [Treponema sp.]